MFYIVPDYIPLRLFGMTILTIYFFISILFSIGITFLMKRKSRIIIIVSIVQLCLLLYFVLSLLNYPSRDVVQEIQGPWFFLYALKLGIVSKNYVEQKKIALLLIGVCCVTYGIIICGILLAPYKLVGNYHVPGVRWEGLYTSSPILGLIILVFYEIKRKKIGDIANIILLLICIFILILAAIYSGTRSTISCVILASAIMMGKLFDRNTYLPLLALTILTVAGYLYVNDYLSDEFLQYTSNRWHKVTYLDLQGSRIEEIKVEINLWLNSYLFGNGFGLVNTYGVNYYSDTLFGHNITSFILSRGGLFLFFLLSVVLVEILKFNVFENYIMLIILILFCQVANCFTYQIMAIYGLIVANLINRIKNE